MKMVYTLSRRQAGKVIMPMSVFAVRTPSAFGNFYGTVAQVGQETQTGFVDSRDHARAGGHDQHLSVLYGRSQVLCDEGIGRQPGPVRSIGGLQDEPLFTEAERAALDYATELTRDKKVSTDTFARLQKFYSEREICDIVWLVASEHIYNMTNVGLGIGSDGLCELNPQRAGGTTSRGVGEHSVSTAAR